MTASTKSIVENSLIPIVNRPSYIAYKILYFGFIALPILAGLDKYFNFLTDWSVYLSPWISKIIYPPLIMQTVGFVEIVAGIIVAIMPKYGAYIVAFWLIALKVGDLSVVYSLRSMQFVFVLIASYFFLGEKIDVMKAVGTLCIAVGIFLVVIS